MLLMGFLLMLSGIKKLRCRCLVSGCGRSVMGSVFLVLGVLLLGVGTNLYTYHRLVNEQFVGLISIHKTKNGLFEVVFKRSAGTERYELDGDAWQLDSKILKWKGVAYLFGFDTVFRLERLSGRYRHIDVAKKQTVRMFSLAEPDGIDLWDWVHEHQSWVPWVDAIYGNSVYMPMENGRQYEIQVGLTGLIARPITDI